MLFVAAALLSTVSFSRASGIELPNREMQRVLEHKMRTSLIALKTDEMYPRSLKKNQHKRAYHGTREGNKSDDANFRRYHTSGNFGFNIMNYGSQQHHSNHHTMNDDVHPWDPNPWGEEPCIPYDEYVATPELPMKTGWTMQKWFDYYHYHYQRSSKSTKGSKGSKSSKGGHDEWHKPMKKPKRKPKPCPTEPPVMVPTSEAPSQIPSVFPSMVPSDVPSNIPSVSPSDVPSVLPSTSPSDVPSVVPSMVPSAFPTMSEEPSASPSQLPSISPSEQPSSSPSLSPTLSEPTLSPTAIQMPIMSPVFFTRPSGSDDVSRPTGGSRPSSSGSRSSSSDTSPSSSTDTKPSSSSSSTDTTPSSSSDSRPSSSDSSPTTESRPSSSNGSQSQRSSGSSKSKKSDSPNTDTDAVAWFTEHKVNHQTTNTVKTRRNLSPFTLQFTVAKGKDPSADEKDDLVAETDVFLVEYFSVLFSDPKVGVTLDFFMVSSPADAVVRGDAIAVNFTGVAIFDEGVVPTTQEMNILTKKAFFVGDSLGEFLDLLKMKLSQSNPFASTSAATFIAQSPAVVASPETSSGLTGSSNESPSTNSTSVALITVLSLVMVGVTISGIIFYRREGKRHEYEKEEMSLAESEIHTEGGSSIVVEPGDELSSTAVVCDGITAEEGSNEDTQRLLSSFCFIPREDAGQDCTEERRFVIIGSVRPLE